MGKYLLFIFLMITFGHTTAMSLEKTPEVNLSWEPSTFCLAQADTLGFAHQYHEFMALPNPARALRSQRGIDDSRVWLGPHYDGIQGKRFWVGRALNKSLLARVSRFGVDPSGLAASCIKNLMVNSQQDPSNSSLQLGLGLMNLLQGDRWTALGYLRRAVFILEEEAKRQPGGTEEAMKESLLRLAWNCRNLALWDEALLATKKGQALFPDYGPFQLLEGLILAGSGNGAEAMSFAVRMAPLEFRQKTQLSMGFSKRPSGFANQWIKSQVLMSEGDFDGAVHVLGDLESELAQRLPFAISYWNDVGLAYELAGRQEALQIYLKSSSLFHMFIPLEDHGHSPVVLHHPNARHSCHTSSLNHYIGGSPFTYLAFQLNRMIQNPSPDEQEQARENALDMLRILHGKGVDDSLCQAFRGRILLIAGRNTEAIGELRAAHAGFRKAGQSDSGTCLSLGMLELTEGRTDQAEELFKEAAESAPLDANIWENLGIAYSRNGQTEMALVALDRALELDAKDAARWFNRGLLKFHMGQLGESLTDLEMAWKLNPEDARIPALLQRVSRAHREQSAGVTMPH